VFVRVSVCVFVGVCVCVCERERERERERDRIVAGHSEGGVNCSHRKVRVNQEQEIEREKRRERDSFCWYRVIQDGGLVPCGGRSREKERKKDIFWYRIVGGRGVMGSQCDVGVRCGSRSVMWESTEREKERESFVWYRILGGLSDGGVSCLQCNVRVDLGEEAVDVVAQAHHLSARVADCLDRSQHRIKVRHLCVHLCIHIHI